MDGSSMMEETVVGLGPYWRLKLEDGRVYLTKISYEGGRQTEKGIGNVEALEVISDWFRNRGYRLDKRTVRKILEQVFEGNCPPCKCKGVEGRSPLAPRAGFEPARGLPHRLSRPASHGQEPHKREWKLPETSNPQRHGETGKILKLPGKREFLDWLGVNQSTKRDYSRYYDKLATLYPQGIPFHVIPELSANKWQRNLVRKLAEYQWAQGRISWEDKLRIEALAKPPKGSQARRIQSILYTVEDLKRTLELVQEPRYRLLYIIMYYSGARITEAIELLRIAKELDSIRLEEARRRRGYVVLGESVRVAMHYNRGRKRCEYLWMPKWLLELVMAQSEKGVHVTSDGARSYYRDLKVKHPTVKLMPPGDVRALQYQILEDLEVDLEIRYVIQNRYSRLTVSELHYSKILRRADEAYEQRILPFLEEKLKG